MVALEKLLMVVRVYIVDMIMIWEIVKESIYSDIIPRVSINGGNASVVSANTARRSRVGLSPPSGVLGDRVLDVA